MKKFIAFLLCFVMLMALAPATFAATSKTTLAVGDIVQIGTYGEGALCEPVTYKVMGMRDADGDGTEDLFLASTKIVTVKQISGWSKVLYKGAVANTALASDLRGWLNSDAASFVSSYDGKPTYAGKPGFMSGMTAAEKAQIVDANITSLVGISADTVKNGGNADVSGTIVPSLPDTAYWPQAWTDMEENYADLQKVSHTDKVFIPSIEELYTFFGGNNINENINVPMTAAALAENGGSEIVEKQIWLRDNLDADANYVKNKRLQFKTNTAGENYIQILNSGVNGVKEAYGIRPCMYLKADTEIERVNADGIVYQIKQKLTVGDKVQVGTYNNEPVEYKVMGSRDVDGDGEAELFLASSQIVSFKSYNAGAAANFAVSWKANNCGRQPSLRVWLNSNETTVDYGTEEDGTTAVVPTYSSQPGFMAGMTAYEQSQIVPVTQNTTVSDAWDKEHKVLPFDGGSGHFATWNQTFPAAYTNNKATATYDNAAYVTTTDKVFIPSIKDIYDFFGGNVDNATAVSNLNVGCTATAQAEATAGGVGVLCQYSRTMLRDMYFDDTAKLGASLPYVWNGTYALFASSEKASSLEGIRPCMYIKADANVQLASGAAGVYALTAPVSTTDADAYIDYARTSKGTVVRANVYNDSNETKTYMLVMATYDGDVFVDAKLYELELAKNKEGFVDSDVLNCSSGLIYNAFLWEKSELEPMTQIFPIDVTEE